MRVLDLFTGCGGLSLGFSLAGFEITAGVEWWPPAVESYQVNHPRAKVFKGDIREIKPLLFTGYSTGYFAVIVGGPPCQAYSISGNRNEIDPRGDLYLDFFDVVEYFQPQFFVMENVKGLLSMKKFPSNLPPSVYQEILTAFLKLARYKHFQRIRAQRQLFPPEQQEYDILKGMRPSLLQKIDQYRVPLVTLILEKISKIGYHATYRVLNAVNYGVPQNRERVFFIGSKTKDFLTDIFPSPTHSCPAGPTRLDAFLNIHSKPWVTARDAIDDLKTMPENTAFSHVFTHHSPEFIEKIKHTKPGESLYTHYSEAYYRLRPTEPAYTVKENHGGVFLHYDQDRCLTPRELARLQSFPDSFLFKGTKSEILKQIGNAVPPLLAKAIAMKLKKFVKSDIP